MKEVLILGLTPPLEGGSEMQIYEIAKALDTSVLTQKGSICKNKLEISIINSKISYIKNLSFMLFSIPKILSVLFNKRFKIVHIHENYLFFFIPLFKLFGKKAVITVHGITGFRFFDNKLLWPIYKFFMRFSNKIIAVGLEDYKKLKNYLKSVIYIPNGVDISLFKDKIQVKKKITFFGRIHEQKGIIYLIKAFALIKNNFPEFTLELIGKKNEYSKRLEKEYPFANFRGFISDRKKLAHELQSSYIIVLPSLWEGLPLTLFEALASGRPVITSDLPSIRSIVSNGKTAILIKPGNEKELANKISGLIRNKYREKIGKNGKELAKNYDWKIIANQIKQVYNSL